MPDPDYDAILQELVTLLVDDELVRLTGGPAPPAERLDLYLVQVQETYWVFPGTSPRLAIPKTSLELALERVWALHEITRTGDPDLAGLLPPAALFAFQ